MVWCSGRGSIDVVVVVVVVVVVCAIVTPVALGTTLKRFISKVPTWGKVSTTLCHLCG